MITLLRSLLQLAAYAAFAVLIGYFASMPSYRYAESSDAVVKLSLGYTTKRVNPCVALTPEQIAELAANMRRTESCERERRPLEVELDIDGRSIVDKTVLPSGVWNDGPASVYETFRVPAGPHTIAVRLRDSARPEGWDYEASIDAVLEAGRYFTITFKSETGEFLFR